MLGSLPRWKVVVISMKRPCFCQYPIKAGWVVVLILFLSMYKAKKMHQTGLMFLHKVRSTRDSVLLKNDPHLDNRSRIVFVNYQ